MNVDNSKKIILDLCEGTGAATKEYRKAGYDVRGFDIKRGRDVRLHDLIKDNPYGIWASPDCTELAGSGARWWAGKGETALLKAMSVFDACIRICWAYNRRNPLAWYAIENPVGRVIHKIGKPDNYYQPCEYGDPWTKKTCLWGEYNMPVRTPVEPTEGSKIHKYPPSENRAELRSIISLGFARGFFKANR